MLLATVIVAFVGGTALACSATHFAEKQAALERCGGAMVLAALSIVGAALPLFR